MAHIQRKVTVFVIGIKRARTVLGGTYTDM
jgi:hypothetical protein